MIDDTGKSYKLWLLYFILFGSMFLVGFIESIKGISFPLIKAEFDIPYEKQGIMVSFLSFCYVLSCLAAGIFLGNFGVKKVFTSGFVFLISGLVAVFFMPNFFTIVAAQIFLTAGFGIIEVSSNALAARLFVRKAALLMSILHFFYGAGSSLSPRAAGAVSSLLNWRYVYLFSIPLLIALFIPYITAKFPKENLPAKTPDKNDAKSPHTVSFFAAVKTPMVWYFSVLLGFMVAVEVSSLNWAALYFQDVYSLDPKTSGALFISNFYILFTISRLTSGFIIEKAGYMRSLYFAAIATTLTLLLGFFFGAGGIKILPVLGFFTAIFWPTVLATAMGYFRDDAPVMTNAIIVITGAINSVIQLLMGLTNRVIGPAWGYRSAVLYAALTIVFIVILNRRMEYPYRSQSRDS